MAGSYKRPSYVMPRKDRLARSNPRYSTLYYLARSAFTDETEFMQYVRLIPGGDYDAFLKAWEHNLSIPDVTGTGRPTLDTLAKNLGIDALTLILDLVRACNNNCMSVSHIISAIAHPQVVLRNIKEALKPDGIKDRTLFFERRGELPRSGVNVNVDTHVTSVAGAKSEATPLPDFEEQSMEASKIVRQELSDE